MCLVASARSPPAWRELPPISSDRTPPLVTIQRSPWQGLIRQSNWKRTHFSVSAELGPLSRVCSDKAIPTPRRTSLCLCPTLSPFRFYRASPCNKPAIKPPKRFRFVRRNNASGCDSSPKGRRYSVYHPDWGIRATSCTGTYITSVPLCLCTSTFFLGLSTIASSTGGPDTQHDKDRTSIEHASYAHSPLHHY